MATVRIPPILRPEAGNNRHVEADGQTVREVLESLVDSYPSLRGRIFEGDDLPQFLNVFIDGTDVRDAVRAVGHGGHVVVEVVRDSQPVTIRFRAGTYTRTSAQLRDLPSPTSRMRRIRAGLVSAAP